MKVEDSLEASSGSATEELYHTNLLRLQAAQLLSESILYLSSHTGLLDKEVKWAKDVHAYIDDVKNTIMSMGKSILSPDDVVFHNTDHKDKTFWIQLHSDKARKHFESDDDQHKWRFHFAGGESLKITPINSYAANGAGLTTSFANANILPTIDLAVLMPPKTSNGSDEIGMIGGKDYLNGRYFDVSTFLVYLIILVFIIIVKLTNSLPEKKYFCSTRSKIPYTEKTAKDYRFCASCQ